MQIGWAFSRARFQVGRWQGAGRHQRGTRGVPERHQRGWRQVDDNQTDTLYACCILQGVVFQWIAVSVD